jgi:hypothetical protein
MRKVINGNKINLWFRQLSMYKERTGKQEADVKSTCAAITGFGYLNRQYNYIHKHSQNCL